MEFPQQQQPSKLQTVWEGFHLGYQSQSRAAKIVQVLLGMGLFAFYYYVWHASANQACSAPLRTYILGNMWLVVAGYVPLWMMYAWISFSRPGAPGQKPPLFPLFLFVFIVMCLFGLAWYIAGAVWVSRTSAAQCYHLLYYVSLVLILIVPAAIACSCCVLCCVFVCFAGSMSSRISQPPTPALDDEAEESLNSNDKSV